MNDDDERARTAILLKLERRRQLLESARKVGNAPMEARQRDYIDKLLDDYLDIGSTSNTKRTLLH